MHREIYEHLEDVLSGAPPILAASHLKRCRECRDEVLSMQEQAALVRQLKATAEIEPRVGFYARVLERIDAEGPVSIWNLFAESAFGRRIAVASLALALLLGFYLVSAERSAEPMVASQPGVQLTGASPSTIAAIEGEDAPGVVLSRLDQAPGNPQSNSSQANGAPSNASQPNDDMLVNLVTYREQ